MRRTGLFLAVVLLVGALAGVQRAEAATPVSGVITQDTTWTTAGSPYQVTGNLGIDTGVTLTIQAGVSVQVMGPYKIQVAGRLVTQGTDASPVTFTCTSQSKGCWTGIEFTDSQSGSDIDGAHIGYADIAIDTKTNPWSVTDSWLHHSNEGIHASGSCCASVGVLSHNYISANTTGVNVFFKLATFTLNTITSNTKGVFLLGEGDIIQNNNIYGNSSLNMDACFFPGDSSVDATNNWWGTTDAAAIEAKICHHNDDLNYPTIDYDPFATALIPSAATAPTPAPSPTPSPSATPSATPSPSPTPGQPAEHPRTLSLTLRRHLKAKGKVSTSGAFAGCIAGVEVTIQRKRPSGWRKVAATDSAATGAFAVRIPDRPGRYRASVKETVLGDPTTDICEAARSPTRRHSH